MSDNIIQFYKATPLDQKLKRGDLVRLVNMDEYDDDEVGEFFEDLVGVVTGIVATFGEDSEAPGQAAFANIAIPEEEGWTELDSVSLYHLRRILGEDSRSLRGYVNEEV